MAHINRKYIDKHWLSFVLRGGVAIIFGFLALFGALNDFNFVISMLVVYLLTMGIIDATGALYSSMKKRGWINSVIDALIDVAAALCLLFMGQNNLAASMVILTGLQTLILLHVLLSMVYVLTAQNVSTIHQSGNGTKMGLRHLGELGLVK